jgi:sporulation protein YlmC with PRC-barrel domain
MLKKLALSAPILVLGTSLVLAQGTVTNEAPSGSSAAMSPSSISGSQWPVSSIYKAAVYDNYEQKIGDVENMVINETDAKIPTAIIGVGGFLGIGQKDVAVPFKDLKISHRNGKEWLVLNRTKEELKSAPAWSAKGERQQQTSGRSVAAPSSSLSTTKWLMSDVYKADVYDNSEHKIGKITDLMIDRNGDITDVAISVFRTDQSVVGTGQKEKEVAVPFKDLRVSSPEGKDWLVLDMSKNELMSAPAFNKSTENKM